MRFLLSKFMFVFKKINTLFLIFFAFLNVGFLSGMDRVVYALNDEPIDVVIPCCENDLETLELCIAGIKTNGSKIRRVIVVSKEKLTESAEWFCEEDYPFTKEEIAWHLCQKDKMRAQEYSKKGSRLGWYYQQLLKLYAPFIIPDISSNVLVLDADTIFLNPVRFLNASKGSCLNPSDDDHLNYFYHADRLSQGAIKKLYPFFSGISHHMLFQKPILKDLFNLVERIHQEEFWKAFCRCVDERDLQFSGASEYEIYFNFALQRTHQTCIRLLKWKNITDLDDLPFYQTAGYHFVSCHHPFRKNLPSQNE